jgi:hypothetical protein
VEYLVRVDCPEREKTRATEKELSAAYAHLTEISSATVTWTDGGVNSGFRAPRELLDSRISERTLAESGR